MEKSCTTSSGKYPETSFVFIHYGMLQRRSCSCHCLDICSSTFRGYAEGVLRGGLCGVPVLLQMDGNLSDLVLSDQLSCQKTCKSFSASSHWLKAIILPSCWKELQTILFHCLERTGSITEHLQFETGGGGGKFHQPSWKVKLQSEFAVNHVDNTVYLKQFMSCIV